MFKKIINMDKIKDIIMSPLFVSGVTCAIGLALIFESHPLYAGVAFGVAGIKFLDAFKSIK